MTNPPPFNPFLKRLQRLWQAAVEPAPSLKGPLERQRARLLNSLMVVFLPLAIVVLIVQIALIPVQSLSNSNTLKAVIMGIALVLLIYMFSRAGYYRFTTYFVMFVGLVAIITNAIASTPPHLEIAYLIMLPLLGTLLLSFRETLVLAIITIICLIGFDIIFHDNIPLDIIKDLLIFTMFTEAFILFVSHHRNRLEADRQQLVIERERNSLLKDLIGNLSHDFRTPLTIINTSLYLLKRIKDPYKQQEKIDQIEQQTQRLSRLIDDIILISELDYKVDQSLQPVDVSSLLEFIVTRFRSEIDRKNLDIQLDLNRELSPVLSNHDYLEQALKILVENAVHYTDTGGITLRTCQQQGNVMAEVSDTGIGISETDLPLIFDRFYRADSARSTYTGGTGLGLAIARRIVELHNGHIEVESIEGEGSRFRVWLPVNVARPTA